MDHLGRTFPRLLLPATFALWLWGCGGTDSSAAVGAATDAIGVAELDTASNDNTPGPGADADEPDAGDTSVDDTAETASADDTIEASDADEPRGTDLPPLPTFASCSGASFTPAAKTGFEHPTSSLTAALGDPEHSAQDVIALPSATAAIPGKFAYGDISKDLEDESVEVFVDRCQGWQSLGTVKTNADGRTSYGLGQVDTAAVGVFDVRQVVLGDASVVSSQLRILPAGTKLIVFDIDGTLTTSDEELFADVISDFFEPLYGGTYVPKAYPDAVALTTAWANKGYVLVYMTGRPYWLTRITREWLASLGFAPASLHVADSNSEALPTESGVGSYKATYLKALIAMGYEVSTAYGNASTDIYAYEQAGIAKDRTFIIGKYAGDSGTQAVVDSYTAHLPWIATQPDAVQPFDL